MGLSYDLAKQLEDAGFPTKTITLKEMRELWNNASSKNPVYVPTLSELIDFVDGSDKLKDIENDYIQKALLKLQNRKSE